ncbi:DUF7146 domain-containing protein [Caulobacter sp. DWP3-1-3b2]|uniref:DUF7146 domain-containing protein n=1 Tax=Caulobacter sp. DWP3-1-3b2 TaxID=2804643 RepID=UPI003CF80DB3
MNAALAWQDVVSRTGGNHGAFDGPCPVCGPDRPTAIRRERKVLRLWREADDFARYACARCDAKGVVFRGELHKPAGGAIAQALREPRNPQAEERQRAERAAQADRKTLENIGHAEFVFFSASPIGGTIAETYLASRGLKPGADLRFGSSVPWGYGEGKSDPAMVSAVRDGSGVLTGLQATYLTPDGRKVDRRSFGRLSGGAVHLAEIGPDGVLGVAEGTESALSFTALYGVPTWSTLGTGGLRRFDPPAGLQRLVIAADNGAEGLDAANALAKRACTVCEVVISAPADVSDWNDVIRGAAV